MAAVHFLTFGDGMPQWRAAAARLKRQALRAGIFSSVSAYTLKTIRDDYPEFWREEGRFLLSAQRGCGYWLWKPFLIASRLREIAVNDFLVYADAGSEMVPGSAAGLIDLLPSEPGVDLTVAQLQRFHSVARWTNGHCLQQMDRARQYRDLPQFAATFMLIANTGRSRELIDRWLAWCRDDGHACLIDRPEDAEAEMFEEHRWDQAIFSLVICEFVAQGKVALKSIEVEAWSQPRFPLQGMRNRSPFSRIGNVYRFRLFSKLYNATIRLFVTDAAYFADLAASVEIKACGKSRNGGERD